MDEFIVALTTARIYHQTVNQFILASVNRFPIFFFFFISLFNSIQFSKLLSERNWLVFVFTITLDPELFFHLAVFAPQFQFCFFFLCGEEEAEAIFLRSSDSHVLPINIKYILILLFTRRNYRSSLCLRHSFPVRLSDGRNLNFNSVN